MMAKEAMAMKHRGIHRGVGFFAVFLFLALGLLRSIPAHAAKALPDLRFVRHSVDPEHPAPGQGFRIEVTIQNQGKGDAVHSRVEARSGQSFLGKAEFQGLKPGARDSQSISLTYPGGIQTLAAAPSAPPKEFCLELLINPLKNAGAPIDSPRRLCVTPRTLALPSPPSPVPPASFPGETPQAAPSVPTPVTPQVPLGPVDIRIASLDVSRDKFELELENKDRGRDLRNPLVEVEINQAGKKTRIYREHLTSIPADGTRLLRIPVPKGAKSTDSLEVKVNEGLIGQKGLRGLLDDPLFEKIGKAKIKPLEPQNIQPLAMYVRLQVNGNPSEATVPVGGSANLTWSLPEGSGPSGAPATSIFLRVRSTPFPAEETCGNNISDVTAADGDDFRITVHPDVNWFDGTGHSLTLSDSRYVPGNTYYLMGCFWNRDTGGYTGDWTNQVAVHYGEEFRIFRGIAAPIGTPVGVLLPDLVIKDVRLIRGGENRGKLIIFVGVRSVPRRFAPPEGNFQYRVYVVPSETAAEYRDYMNPLESPLTEGRTWLPYAQVYEGTGRVRNLGLFGYGDAITTDFRIPETGAYTVFVVVNPKYDPYMDPLAWTGLGAFYQESNYFNNHRVVSTGFSVGGRIVAPNNILDLWVESHGPGWAEVGVRYTRMSRGQGPLKLKLVLRGLRIPGYTGPVAPPAGRGPTYAQLFEMQRLTMNCTAADSGAGFVDARRGLDRTARFLCRYSQPGTGVVDTIAFFPLLLGSPDSSLLSDDSRFGELRARLEATLGRGLEGGAHVRLGSGGLPGFFDEGEHVAKVFPFGKVFTGSGAPSLPPRITLRPVQTVTGTQIDYWQSGACIWAVGGSAWPRDLAVPGGSEVLTGYRWDYDAGTQPLPCESRWTYKAHGLTRFNLDLLRREDAASLTRATLSFIRTRTPVSNTCGSPAASVFAANAGFEGRSGSFALAEGQRVASSDHLAAASGSGGRFAVDATALVRQWLNGERANSGFALVQQTGRNYMQDVTCAAQYGDFRLILEFPAR
jgi:hypothetical protein